MPSDESNGEEFTRIRNELLRAVKRRCPGWMYDSIDDIVQNAMLRFLEIRRRREGNPTFSSYYLAKVAYSALVDEIRRYQRRQESPAEVDNDTILSRSGGLGPEAELLSLELGQAIRECLTQLIEPRREAVTLHLLGHTVPEAARLLKWDCKKTENLVYRGMSDLRQCLRTKGMSP